MPSHIPTRGPQGPTRIGPSGPQGAAAILSDLITDPTRRIREFARDYADSLGNAGPTGDAFLPTDILGLFSIDPQSPGSPEGAAATTPLLTRTGDKLRKILSSVRGQAAPAIHIPQTSTRVEEARRALEAAGIDTRWARQIVPPRGTQAAEFQRGLQSIGLQSAPSHVQEVPSIEQLIGPGYRDLGRMGLQGASPKRVLESASGERWIHKGTPLIGAHRYMSADPQDILASHSGIDVAAEEAGTRFSRLMNRKTPIAHEVIEGGTLQQMIPGKMTNLGQLEVTNPKLFASEPLARQMQTEHIVDTLGRIDDRHMGQFMVDESTGIMWPVDKGINYLHNYQKAPLAGMGDLARGRAYHNFNRGGAWNQFVDPNLGQQFIRDRIMSVPEQSFREALGPVFKFHGMSQGDQDTAVRNVMQSIQMLPSMFDKYYQTLR